MSCRKHVLDRTRGIDVASEFRSARRRVEDHRNRVASLRSWRGFTLIEAVIVLAVVSILIAVAVPAWTSAMAATRNSSVRGLLYESLLQANTHATITSVEVVLCSSDNGVDCSRSPDWSEGWIAFADLDGDRRRSGRETLLRHQPALEGGTRLRSTGGRTRLVFQPNGGAAGSNVTFTLCDDRGPDEASTVVMANSSRLRQGKPSQKAAFACVYGG